MWWVIDSLIVVQGDRKGEKEVVGHSLTSCSARRGRERWWVIDLLLVVQGEGGERWWVIDLLLVVQGEGERGGGS